MPTLPLKQMMIKEKLQVMEEFWSDLCCNQNYIPVPKWLEACIPRQSIGMHVNG